MNYKISLSAVNIPDETYAMMEEALRGKKIGQTEIIKEFEDRIARFVGSKYCIAISNGTMADAVAVAAMKVTFPKKKAVIVPALTFIAQPNSVRYNNLPVIFVDVKENWLLDLSNPPLGRYDIEDVLIFGTDLMGKQVDGEMELEDACEAFGSLSNDRYSGTLSLLGTYSFFPSHTISTGEGGAIVTDDVELDLLCRSIRAHGAVSSDPMEKFHFPNPGFNARLSSIQAVLGIALMNHIQEYIRRRRSVFIRMQILGGFDEKPREEIVPHGYPIEFESEQARDNAMMKIISAGIECRKFFSCIPLEEKQFKRKGSFPVAQHISHTHLYLPCHQNMTDDDVDYVIRIVRDQKGIITKTCRSI